MAAKLRFTTGSLQGRDVPIPEPQATVGRDPSVDIVIPLEDQRFVSRVHAAICRDGAGFVIEDRGSSNGTLVNGRRVPRAVLTDGDEIQFGRQGPVARFVHEEAGATVLADEVASGRPAVEPGGPGPAKVPPVVPPAVPPAVSTERPSELVRRVVTETMASSARRERRRFVLMLLALVVLSLAGIVLAARFGWLNRDPDEPFRELADLYKGRVALIGVGVRHEGTYIALGWGSGFFASEDGLVVTNKHVTHPELAGADGACLAASFERRGIAFDKVRVLTVWPGGTRFRQDGNPAADIGLGFSTDVGTLAIAAVAPNTQVRPRELVCDDSFGGGRFRVSWREIANDNNDLSVLRVITDKPPPAIPLSDRETVADDPVMVLGFPRGVTPLETAIAEPIRRVGRVLRTQDTIQIDAVVLGGNSGGPLIGADGGVVGITTRGAAESLNMALKVEYARRLLDRARQASSR